MNIDNITSDSMSLTYNGKEMLIKVYEQEIERLKEEYIMLQNAGDEVEEEKDKEIERLNNIINEFDDFITNVDSHINLGDESEEFILVRDKWLELQELKGSDKE